MLGLGHLENYDTYESNTVQFPIVTQGGDKGLGFTKKDSSLIKIRFQMNVYLRLAQTILCAMNDIFDISRRF